jgi:hypothetical protein
MGTSANGLPPKQQAYLQAAKTSGVTVDALTLMTMNMGGKDNVADAQSAIAGGTKQLASVYGLNMADATKKMGMLPAIGVDNNGVVIDLGGATKRECVCHLPPTENNQCAVGWIVNYPLIFGSVGQFAKSNQLAVLSYWNFNRDFPGGSGTAQVLDASSSPDQKQDSQFFTTFQSALGSGNTIVPNVASVAQAAKQVDTSNTPQPGQKQALPPASAPNKK